MMCPKMVELHTFQDICTPQARLARPLSKDGYLTLEKILESQAGHQLILARMVTGGSTTAATMVANNSST